MKTKNTAFYSLRLNLDNKQHREVFEILQSLDKNIFKSRNQFIVDCIDERIRCRGKKTGIEQLTKDEIVQEIVEKVGQEIDSRIYAFAGKAFLEGGAERKSSVKEPVTEKVSEEKLDDVLGDLASEWANMGE